MVIRFCLKGGGRFLPSTGTRPASAPRFNVGGALLLWMHLSASAVQTIEMGAGAGDGFMDEGEKWWEERERDGKGWAGKGVPVATSSISTTEILIQEKLPALHCAAVVYQRTYSKQKS